jgi:hypothetical protein
LLGRPGTIKGTAKSALDGTVLSGVKVTVGSEIAHDTSDYSGNYTISTIPCGNHVVKFEYPSSAVQFWYEAAAQDSATKVKVTASSTTSDIDASLCLLNCSIAGLVCDSLSRAALANFSVKLDGNGADRSTNTNEQGRYEFHNVDPKTSSYHVSASGSGYDRSGQHTVVLVQPGKRSDSDAG